MIRNVIVALLAVVLSVAVASPSHATELDRSTPEKRVEEVVATAQNAVRSATDKGVKGVQDEAKLQQEQAEQRKSELKAAHDKRLEERASKLEGRRLAQCQNREDAINDLIDKSVSLGNERFARMQRIEAAVTEFYMQNELSSTQFDDAVKKANEQEVLAQGALSAFDDLNYDCTKVDGSNPSETIRVAHEAKKQAFDGYRESVKELVVIVKQAFVDSQQQEEVGEV